MPAAHPGTQHSRGPIPAQLGRPPAPGPAVAAPTRRVLSRSERRRTADQSPAQRGIGPVPPRSGRGCDRRAPGRSAVRPGWEPGERLGGRKRPPCAGHPQHESGGQSQPTLHRQEPGARSQEIECLVMGAVPDGAGVLDMRQFGGIGGGVDDGRGIRAVPHQGAQAVQPIRR